MSIEFDKYLKKQQLAIDQFSARFMSDAKWLKLFRLISANHIQIGRCYIIDIYEFYPCLIEIPIIAHFDESFDDNGIKDVFPGGPMLFKEIRWLEFPASWAIEKKMREEILQPIQYSQNLTLIEELITTLGKFEIEKEEKYLRIFGYK